MRTKIGSLAAICILLMGFQGILWFRTRKSERKEPLVVRDASNLAALRWNPTQLFQLESWKGHGLDRTDDGAFILHDVAGRASLYQAVALNQMEPKAIRITFEAQMFHHPVNVTVYVDLALVTRDNIYGQSKTFLLASKAWESFDYQLNFQGRIIERVNVHFFCAKGEKVSLRNSKLVQESEEWVHGILPIQNQIKLSTDFQPTMQCSHASAAFAAGGPLVTAVMLHWKRTSNVVAQVDAFLNYSFIGEVIIWNNNPHYLLTRSQFGNSSTRNRVRTVNSPANLHDYAKYLACSQARYEYCYFQDEDWENCHLNELYASFIMAPNIIHLVSMPDLVWEHHYWSSWDQKLGLKANFAWLGTGSFIPQQLTRNFLQQLSFFDLEGFSLMTIDAWFVLWTNSDPCKLQVKLQSLAPPKDDAWSAGRDHFAILYGHMNRALGILVKELETGNPLFRHQDHVGEHPESVRWLKAICTGKGMPCLFKSSLSYLVPKNLFPPWDSSVLIQNRVVLGKNPYAFAQKHHFLAAVDGSPDTCLILPSSSEPFFIGLDLLEQKFVSEIILHSPHEGKVSASFSNSGDSWIHAGDLEKRPGPVQGLRFGSEKFVFRHVHLRFGPTSERTSICEVTVILKGEKTSDEENDRNVVDSLRNLPSNSLAPGITTETGASAVLILWKRNSTLAGIVKHITSHSWVKEIVIWNNNPETIIRHNFIVSLLHPQSQARVKVINSPQNMLFLARFLACEMASEAACFFQDDDWLIKSMNALFYQWKRHPHMLHSLTNPLVHYLSWAWTFCWKSPTVEVATGFSWLGTGAVASRKVVGDFLQQLTTVADSPDIWNHADMYFSTWMNSVPYQLSADLTELTSEFSYTHSDKGGIDRNKRHIRDGARLMHLNPDAFLKFPLKPSWSERWVRSPCASDTCLFFASAHVFPDPLLITYDPSFSLDQIQDRHLDAFGKDRYEQWLRAPYHHAVDASMETFFLLPQGLHIFGLFLTTTSPVHGIQVKVGETLELKKFKLEILIGQEGWLPIKYGDSSKRDGTVSFFFVHKKIEGVRFVCQEKECNAMRIYNVECF